ncbi:MAG: phytanoyl-CoA dioxygenase [Alphaproteobacteria bacterium]|nr:phytanoyl-CoA dioxygenase [Alphaproteobacteria bacterium]
MGKKLSEAEVTRYRRDGCLFPVPGLTPDEARHYRAKLEAFEAAQGMLLSTPGNSYRLRVHALFRWAYEIATHGAVLDAVEDLLGPDILIYTSTLFIKEPKTPMIAAWHQDATYFGLEPHEHVTAWVALTDASAESGCMEFIPGSPAMGQLMHKSKAHAHSINGGAQKIAVALDASKAIHAPLKPGEFSFHNTLLVHRSEPNHSAHRRIGYGVSYIPTGVRHVGSVRVPAMLARGTDRFGHFDLETPPGGDFDAAAQAAHKAAYVQYRVAYNEQVARFDGLAAGAHD